MKFSFKLMDEGQKRIFSRLGKRLPGFLSPKKAAGGVKELLCVQIEDQEIKVVLTIPTISGAREISAFWNFPIEQGNVTAAADTIKKEILEKQGLKSVGMVGIVPSYRVLTRNLEIPSRDTKEIRDIVNLQATRHTPYARNEIVVDFLNLGPFKTVYTKVLLIIVPRVFIMRYFDLAAALGMPVSKVEFSSEVIAKSVWNRLRPEDTNELVCLLRFDTASTEFMILQNSLSLFVRSIPVGTQHLNAAREGYLIRLNEEFKKSLDAYRNENVGGDPKRVILAGACEGLEDFQKIVESSFNLPVKKLPDVEGIPMAKGARDKYLSEGRSLLPIMAAGLLLESATVDLSPEESKLKKTIEERSKEIVKTGILAMTLLGLFCIYFISIFYFQGAQLDTLEKRFAPIKKEAKELEASYARVRAVKSHFASQGKPIQTLVELYEFMPLDAYLTRFEYDSRGDVTVKGTAFKKTSIFALTEEMESSPFLKNVQTKFITGRIEEGIELADFEIQALSE